MRGITIDIKYGLVTFNIYTCTCKSFYSLKLLTTLCKIHEIQTKVKPLYDTWNSNPV
jgi:hypothetical protein